MDNVSLKTAIPFSIFIYFFDSILSLDVFQITFKVQGKETSSLISSTSRLNLKLKAIFKYLLIQISIKFNSKFIRHIIDILKSF